MADMTDASKQNGQLPISHPVPVMSLPAHGRNIEFEASNEELLAIAKTCNLVSVENFAAQFHVTKGKGSLIEVQGSLNADVVQTCGVTLEPVQEHVGADISLTYTLDSESQNLDAVEFDFMEDDPPEPVIEGHIDFGTVALEHFVLHLNPYPRKPEAHFSAETQAKGEKTPDSAASGPFSALSVLKEGK